MDEPMPATSVAVFNAHADTVTMLHLALQHAGFETIDAPLHEFDRGIAEALAFLQTHEPDVVVYDVSPPYERTAAFCCDLQEADERLRVGHYLHQPSTDRQELARAAGTVRIDRETL
jgi:CheY-like chemotaxis protein